MKNTQKKLKKKHYRYLSKEEAADPMVYIHEFFGRGTDIKWWKTDVSILVDAAYTGKGRIPGFEYGYVYKRIIQQVEAAHAIYCLPGFDGTISRTHTTSVRDVYKLTNGSPVTNPAKIIDRFFSFRPLEQWVETIDDMLDCLFTHKPVRSNDDILQTKDLLLELGEALGAVHENKGIELNPHPLFFVRKTGEADRGADDEVPKTLTNDTPPFYPEKKIHFPEWLKHEIRDVSAIRAFFDVCGLEDWRNQLWQWLHVVTVEGLVWSKPVTSSTGSSLLFDYRCYIRLIDLVFGITEPPRADGSNGTKHAAQSPITHRDTLCARHNGKPVIFKHISSAEALQPASVLQEFVAAFSRQEWQEILYDWLEYALSEKANTQSRYANSTLHCYQLLNRLMEACFLIAHSEEITFEHTVE